ncbi:MAG: hypothetical protein WBA17_15250 [Saprospiraceae bacterium]
MSYTIERTESEILIKLPLTTMPQDIQGILNYLRYMEIGRKNQMTQQQVDELAREVKAGWWEKNKVRFKDVPGFEGLV